nr:hydrolase tropi [Quercus suber]
MADEDIATKAIESDAQESSNVPDDSRPDQGAASMGEITKFDDIEVYVTKPADYPHAPSKLLLLLTGNPAPTATTTTGPVEQNPSVIEQIKLGLASVAKLFTIDMWLAYHTPEKVLPILRKVIESVKEEFGDAVANGGGIYAVGYCFGAKYALLLGSAAKDSETTTDGNTEQESAKQADYPLIKVAAIAHGTQITENDFENVKIPTSVVAVEDDPLFPDHVREGGKRMMEANSVESELKVYPGVPHGFAVLGDYDDATIMEKQEEAFGQMLAWLKMH